MTKLSWHGNRERINFVKAKLDFAITRCLLAQDVNVGRRPEHIKIARRAYDNAQRHLFKLDMGDKEFANIAALAERVKFMLEALEQ